MARCGNLVNINRSRRWKGRTFDIVTRAARRRGLEWRRIVVAGFRGVIESVDETPFQIYLLKKMTLQINVPMLARDTRSSGIRRKVDEPIGVGRP